MPLLRSVCLAVCLASLAGFSSPALAQDCSNAQTTRDMVICAQQDYDLADGDLNRVYQDLRQTLDPTAKTILRDAQRAWIKFRDAECARHRDAVRGGTMEPLMEISCLADLTTKRTQELSVNPLSGESIY